MEKQHPPHLHREVSRHGREMWFVRIGHGPRTRLPSPYGTKEFWAAYTAAVSGVPAVHGAPTVRQGTLAWLIAAYQQTPAWIVDTAKETKKQRRSIFTRLIAKAGQAPMDALDVNGSLAVMEDRPHAARNLLETLRALYGWAVAAGHIARDPTAGVTWKRPKTEGFKVWTPELQATFEAHYPTGCMERLAYDVFAFTGLRRGDAARLGFEHLRDGILSIQTEKNGAWVHLPLADELAASIAATPRKNQGAFIENSYGRPYTKESLGNWFREVCRAAGIPNGYSAHGLRKATATKLAENGGTLHELNAFFGWTGHQMASHYTASADRKRQAISAAEKLASRTSSLTLTSGSGRAQKKSPQVRDLRAPVRDLVRSRILEQAKRLMDLAERLGSGSPSPPDFDPFDIPNLDLELRVVDSGEKSAATEPNRAHNRRRRRS